MSRSDLLPPGWAEVTVGDLFEELRAKVPADPNSPLLFIGMDHVESDTMRLLGSGRFSEMKSAGTRFHPGDVLYGRLRPYLNKVLKADFDGVSSAEFLVFPQMPAISSDFLKFVLTDRAFVAFASHPDNVTGDRPRIDFDTIKKYALHLPPAPNRPASSPALKSFSPTWTRVRRACGGRRRSSSATGSPCSRPR